jgi:uncharacterized protein (UPF0332 family)
MPESEDYLNQAALALEEAIKALGKELPRSAAREAYVCCLAVARALIFEARQTSPKTHSGTRSTIGDILRSRKDYPQDLETVLNDGFKAKQRIDYGPPISIDMVDASRRVAKAKELFDAARFIVLQTNSKGKTE